MSRYNDIEYIKKLKIKYALKLVAKAMKEENRNQLFQLYLSDRPRMERIISFDDYLNRVGFKDYTETKYDNRSADEILNELNLIKKEGS